MGGLSWLLPAADLGVKIQTHIFHREDDFRETWKGSKEVREGKKSNENALRAGYSYWQLGFSPAGDRTLNKHEICPLCS